MFNQHENKIFIMVIFIVADKTYIFISSLKKYIIIDASQKRTMNSLYKH